MANFFFGFSIILMYCIARIIYIVINFPNNFSILIIFLHGHCDFSRNIIWSKFLFHVVNISWIIFGKLFYSFSMIVGHFFIVNYPLNYNFIYAWLDYKFDSYYLIKIELWSVFPTLDTLIVSGTFHELRCSTIWYPVELCLTFMCFTVQGLTKVWKNWSYIGEGMLFIHIQKWICIKLHPTSWYLHVKIRGYPSTKEIFCNTFQSGLCCHIS